MQIRVTMRYQSNPKQNEKNVNNMLVGMWSNWNSHAMARECKSEHSL